MENYQTLFPACSSSSSTSSTMVNSNSKGNNGFLGLMSDMEVSGAGGLSVMNNNNNQNEGKSSSGKKKGSEKKIRKPRYAFQTRSQVDVLDDGSRWRKYGQKEVKNNKFPRNYYRCSHQGCKVKKQIQRLTKDEGVVVTTYEGMHSHSTENLSLMQFYTSN